MCASRLLVPHEDILRSTRDSGHVSNEKTPNEKFRKRGKNHSKSATKILHRWFATHSCNPYPTDQEKEELQEQSGLSTRQISYWFSNTRRRAASKSSKSPAQPSQSVLPTASSVPNLGASQKWESMNPLDRWRNSPPEDEHACWSAITQAAKRANDINNSSLPGTESNTQPFQFPAPQAQSETSFESSLSGWTSNSSTSAHSAGSHGSHFTSSSAGSLTHLSRRRRRQNAHPRNSLRPSQAKLQDRPYQCTFCTDTFKSKYDWTRHEGTLHLVLEQWVCTAFGPIVSDPSDGSQRCCFCQEMDPILSHLESHNYSACADKPVTDRNFYRKDHLLQHLRLVHGINKFHPSMSSWRHQVISINSRCGFCAERFTIWSDRNEHIADHFKEGTSMREWKGCRGLDPAVALIVENAMPPYLISTEANEFEPFSALSAHQKSQSALAGPIIAPTIAPTPFESLILPLAEYAQEAVRQGIVVTDESVRKQARLIMFGDDDAWNQTPADNAEWLRLFKEGLDLSAAPIKPAAKMHNSAPDCLIPLGSQMASCSANLNVLSCQNTEKTSDHRRTGQLCSQGGLPLSWQTPECLAEFRQMLHQFPDQGITSPTAPSDRCKNGISQAWSSPAFQQSFLGQTSDQGRLQHNLEPVPFDAPSMNMGCFQTPYVGDPIFPFDLDLFEG